MLLAVLLALCFAALGLTLTFPTRAAVFPRASLLAAIVTMGVMIGRGFRGGSQSADAARHGFDRTTMGAVASVVAFAVSIWALGFTWGSLLAVIVMMSAGRERPKAIAVVAGLAVVFVEIVMDRILHVPLPAGAVFESVRGMVAG